jgi:hypothetical protein
MTFWMLPPVLARADGDAGSATTQLDDDDGRRLEGDGTYGERLAAGSGTVNGQRGELAIDGDEAVGEAQHDGQLLTGNQENQFDKHRREGPSRPLAVPGDERGESAKIVDERAEPGGRPPES